MSRSATRSRVAATQGEVERLRLGVVERPHAVVELHQRRDREAHVRDVLRPEAEAEHSSESKSLRPALPPPEPVADDRSTSPLGRLHQRPRPRRPAHPRRRRHPPRRDRARRRPRPPQRGGLGGARGPRRAHRDRPPQRRRARRPTSRRARPASPRCTCRSTASRTRSSGRTGTAAPSSARRSTTARSSTTSPSARPRSSPRSRAPSRAASPSTAASAATAPA